MNPIFKSADAMVSDSTSPKKLRAIILLRCFGCNTRDIFWFSIEPPEPNLSEQLEKYNVASRVHINHTGYQITFMFSSLEELKANMDEIKEYMLDSVANEIPWLD